jgi:hypothetical protein
MKTLAAYLHIFNLSSRKSFSPYSEHVILYFPDVSPTFWLILKKYS